MRWDGGSAAPNRKLEDVINGGQPGLLEFVYGEVADCPVILPPELIVLCTRILHDDPGGALPAGARAVGGNADAADLQVLVPYIEMMTDQPHSGAGGTLPMGSGQLTECNMDSNGGWHARCVDGG